MSPPLSSFFFLLSSFFDLISIPGLDRYGTLMNSWREPD
jgi:hypothetical protein